MPTSVTNHPSSTPLNSLAPRMAKVSTDVNRQAGVAESTDGLDVVSLFFETLAACGFSEKEAAYEMAMDPAQLSRVKSGQARLPMDAVWRLPDRFWLAFRVRIDAAKRLTSEDRRAIQRARLIEVISLMLSEVA